MKFNYISIRNLIYYPADCTSSLTHNCDPCEADELGRIRAVAFIKKDYVFADPTNPVEWTAAINAGSVIIIPKTNGSYDGGTPKEGPGYGDAESIYIGSAFVLKYKDPNYKSNCAFYNGLKRSRNYKVAFLTETQIHITAKACTVLPKNPVADSLDTKVEWDVEVKWIDKDFACPYNIPAGIFANCFLV